MNEDTTNSKGMYQRMLVVLAVVIFARPVASAIFRRITSDGSAPDTTVTMEQLVSNFGWIVWYLVLLFWQ